MTPRKSIKYEPVTVGKYGMSGMSARQKNADKAKGIMIALANKKK